MLELLRELDPLPGLPGRDLAAASGRGRRGRGHSRHQAAVISCHQAAVIATVTRQLSSSFQQLRHHDYILLLEPARHHDYSLKIGHLVTL